MVWDRWKTQAKARQGSVVMPEGTDPLIRAAAAEIAAEGIARVTLIGGTAPGCETIEPDDYPLRGALTDAILARRPGMKPGMAERLLTRPACFAGGLVATGVADAMIAGAQTPSRRVIEAATMTIGLADGVETPSSFFLMQLGARALVFADCALNVAPDAAELADIAIASSRTAEALLGQARTALLSFSTLGSGAGDEADRVRTATSLARARAPDLAICGEYQVDTALNAAIAARKGAEGPVAGQANVLIFPSLEAGNIGYKLVQELAGAQAIGPILQGFAKPVCDLSRGATVDDIVAAAVIAMALEEG